MFSMNKLLGKHLFSKADLAEARYGTNDTRTLASSLAPGAAR